MPPNSHSLQLEPFDYSDRGGEICSPDDSMVSIQTNRRKLKTRSSLRQIMTNKLPSCLQAEESLTMVPFIPSPAVAKQIEDAGFQLISVF